jgi:hypothetical protein
MMIIDIAPNSNVHNCIKKMIKFYQDGDWNTATDLLTSVIQGL